MASMVTRKIGGRGRRDPDGCLAGCFQATWVSWLAPYRPMAAMIPPLRMHPLVAGN